MTEKFAYEAVMTRLADLEAKFDKLAAEVGAWKVEFGRYQNTSEGVNTRMLLEKVQKLEREVPHHRQEFENFVSFCKVQLSGPFSRITLKEVSHGDQGAPVQKAVTA